MIGRFVAHDDKLVRAANLIALVLAWNAPFYPLYVWLVAGSGGMPAALLTGCSFPFFLSVLAITRRHPLLGRVMLTVFGLLNILFCTWVMSEAAGEEIFLIPCTMLAALLFRPSERRVMLPLVFSPLLAYLAFRGHYPAPPHLYTSAQYASLLSMNAISVGSLTIFLGIVLAGALAAE